MRSRRRAGDRVARVALTCLASAACVEEAARSHATVTDSAGVTIVDLGVLDYAALPTWVLEDEPRLRIGVVEGDPARQWSRLDGAGRLSDGTVLGLDKSSREVRAFTQSGAHLWTAGGNGEGPGEFRFPWALTVLPGDSILVSDPGTGRLTVLGPRGEFVRTASVLGVEGQLLTWGLLASDEVLYEVRSSSREADPLILEAYSRLGAVNTEGESNRGFGTFVLDTQYAEGNDPNTAFSPALFDDLALFAPWDGAVWFSANEAYEIERYGPGQALERIVRWSGPDRTIRPEDIERLKSVHLAGAAADAQARHYVEEFFRYQPVSPAFAPFSRMLVDPGGRIWLQDYLREDLPDADAQWLLLAPDGSDVVGRVRHPRRFKPLALGDEWILGVSTDDLDVEYLDLHTLPPH